MDSKAIRTAAAALEAAGPRIERTRFLIGFDGFIDEILHAVAQRQSPDTYERLSTLSEFSERVRLAAGKSANVEIFPLRVKMGGNAPLMSMAVAEMGGKVTCVGLLGRPDIFPAFHPLRDKAELFSLGNPGRTDALEFQDGKLMLGRLDTVRDACWNRIQEVVGAEKFRALVLGAELVACTNWTMLPGMGEILDGLLEMLPSEAATRFFFDLADPQKRSRGDLRQVLGQIGALNGRARCVLGLNLREAEQVAQALNLREAPEESAAGLEKCARALAGSLGIHGVVVHATRCAGSCLEGESAGVEGPYSAAPKLSTGAGDHFNGGFVSGWMGGLGVRDALYAGVGVSGWYVRRANGPTLPEAVAFLRDWAAGKALD